MGLGAAVQNLTELCTIDIATTCHPSTSSVWHLRAVSLRLLKTLCNEAS